MTLKRRRILSSRNWPHEAAQARESMASGRMQRRSQGEFPRCAFSPQAFGGRRAVSCAEDRNLRETTAMSPERAPSATIGTGIADRSERRNVTLRWGTIC